MKDVVYTTFEDDLVDILDKEEDNKFYQWVWDTTEDFYTTPNDLINKLTSSVRTK